VVEQGLRLFLKYAVHTIYNIPTIADGKMFFDILHPLVRCRLLFAFGVIM
jgi:hypothetical protein